MPSVAVMAKKIAKLPTKAAKRRQAHKLCEALVQLLKGTRGAS